MSVPVPHHRCTGPDGSSTIGYANCRQPTDAIHMSKKPKLSLQTSALSVTYGPSSSGPSVSSQMATTTPTTSNTFSNAYDLAFRPSPSSTSSPAVLTRAAQPAFPTGTPRPSGTPDRPYALHLPLGVRSILKNSPIVFEPRRGSVCGPSASPRSGGRRAFFPAPKRVAFRQQLEDEVVTTKYVARHADLSSDSDDSGPCEKDVVTTNTNGGASSENCCEGDVKDGNETKTGPQESRGRRRRREPSPSTSVTEESQRGPSEPRSRRKKRCWEWTLASLSKTNEHAQHESKQEHLEKAQEPTKTEMPGTTDKAELAEDIGPDTMVHSGAQRVKLATAVGLAVSEALS